MSTVISDMGGNMRKISNKADNASMIMDLAENRKNISGRSDTASSIICKSINKNTERPKLLHTCSKGSYDCKEKLDGSLWLYIDTRKIKIGFCPHCGYKAKG